MARIDNPIPRGIYFYKTVEQSKIGARVHFPHFSEPPAIFLIKEESLARQERATYSMSAMFAEYVVKTVPLQVQRGTATVETKAFLRKINPDTWLTNQELLTAAGQSYGAERLIVRAASRVNLLETPPPEKLAVGGVLGIREHFQPKNGQILALEGESLGVAVNEKHKLATAEKFMDSLTDPVPPKNPLDIPAETVLEILQAYIDAQVLIQQARTNGKITRYLTEKQIDRAYRWLDNNLYGKG